MERTTRAILTISGSSLALIGAFLPTVITKFSPPGGHAIVDGKHYNAFVLNYTVMGIPSNQPYSVIRTAVLALLCVGLFDLCSFFFSEENSVRIVQHIARLIHARFTQGVKGLVQALALILEAVGWLVIIFVVVTANAVSGIIGFAHSTSPSALAAGHYASVSLGIGFYFLIVGTILAGIAVYKSLGILAPIILITAYVLSGIGGIPLLERFLHYLGG